MNLAGKEIEYNSYMAWDSFEALSIQSSINTDICLKHFTRIKFSNTKKNYLNEKNCEFDKKSHSYAHNFVKAVLLNTIKLLLFYNYRQIITIFF